MLLFEITGTLRGTFTQRSTQTSEMQHLIIKALIPFFSWPSFEVFPRINSWHIHCSGDWFLSSKCHTLKKKTKTKVITQCNIFQENKYYMYCDVGTLIHSIRGALDASDKFKSSAMLKDSLST